MRLELIESDLKYYEKSDKYSYETKSYANDYELITFDYLSYNYRKFVNSYNNKKTLSKRRAYPIPVGIDLLYVGLHEIYFIDTINFLPTNQEIEIIKIIGPGEIKDNKLFLYNSIEKILQRLNNKTHTIFYYYNWNTNIEYEVSNIDFNYNLYNNNIKINKTKKKDHVYIQEFSIYKKKNINNELKSLPLRLKFIKTGLELLKNGGNLTLQYFNCSQLESLILMISLNECFEDVEFNRSKLRDNVLNGGSYIFQNYNGNKVEKNFNKNIKYISNLKDIKNNEFVIYINKVQKTIYKKFNKFLKKCELITNSKKDKKYYEDYQISIGIDWCNDHNILITNYYNEKLYKDTDLKFLKKIFYPDSKIIYKNLKLYYDSFYSVTLYEDYLEILRAIKKYFPKEKIIVDACSNVGGSTISFSYNFDKVIGIEIEENRFKLLKNNVNVYKKKNIELINDDYLNQEKKYKNNLVFFDPPWSGIYYKIEESIDLYLGNKNIKDCLKSKSILKAPHNFNISDLKDIIIEKSRYYLLIIKK